VDEPVTRLKLGITSDAHSDKLRRLIDLFYQCTRGNASRRPKAEQIYSSLCTLPTCYDVRWIFGTWTRNLMVIVNQISRSWQFKLACFNRSWDLANCIGLSSGVFSSHVGTPCEFIIGSRHEIWPTALVRKNLKNWITASTQVAELLFSQLTCCSSGSCHCSLHVCVSCHSFLFPLLPSWFDGV
jgi:hypothetical protein